MSTPTIAQKLCRDIVEPIHVPISAYSHKRKTFGSFDKNISNDRPFSGKRTSSIHVDKKRVVNKYEPCRLKEPNTNKKLKSEEFIQNTLVDSGINTFITGPLRCNTKCMTTVRARDNQTICKCGNKKINFKFSAKEIQTDNSNKNYRTDKACAHCIEKTNQSTQFIHTLDKSKSNIRSNNRLSFPKCNNDFKFQTLPYYQQSSNEDFNLLNKVSKEPSSMMLPYTIYKAKSRIKMPPFLSTHKPMTIKYMNTKRWALSRYPVRGPDF